VKKAALALISAVAFLASTGCKSPTAPDMDSFIGTWNATKAEFVSIANSSMKVDIIAGGSNLVLVFSSNTFTLTITDPGQNPNVATGTWSSSIDTLTFNWTTGYSGESQFDFSLNGNNLTLTGGHVPFYFTPGNPEEAILNLILVRQ
jgi:hypothetical protein